MAREKKKPEDESITKFELDKVKDYWICQRNDLIEGIQTLSLNAAKIVRAAIMQIRKDDTELKPCVITIKQLSELFGVAPTNLYQTIDDLTDEIAENPIKRKKKNGKGYFKIYWVSYCSYTPDTGLIIKLNSDLKDYLINLVDHFTRYHFDEILSMKSVYAIRIFELLLSRIYRNLPKEGKDIILSLDLIKQSCDCSKGYDIFSNFKRRVLDIAVREINDKTSFHLNEIGKDSYIKQGKMIIAIKFHVNMKYHLETNSEIA